MFESYFSCALYNSQTYNSQTYQRKLYLCFIEIDQRYAFYPSEVDFYPSNFQFDQKDFLCDVSKGNSPVKLSLQL